MTPKRKKAIEERLALIAKQAKGRLTPESVVADAKFNNSPLHHLFEWSDTEAARKYRLHQARQLIASVKVNVTIEDAVFTTVKYVRNPDLKSGRHGEQGYIETSKIKQGSDFAREVMKDEIARMLALVERTNSLADVLDLRSEMDALIASVKAMEVGIEEAA